MLAKGVALPHVLLVVAELLEVEAEEISKPGKERQRVRARSLLCYWAVRELGMTMSAMSRQLGLSVPAIAMAVRRGAAIAPHCPSSECGWSKTQPKREIRDAA